MDLLGLLSKLQSAPPVWLVEWRPLRTHQHNDLNAANVLVRRPADGMLQACSSDYLQLAADDPRASEAYDLARVVRDASQGVTADLAALLMSKLEGAGLRRATPPSCLISTK